jgi:hypothetical protein
MVHYQQDFIYGIEKENEVVEKIRKFFNRDIKKNAERYAKFDFEDDEYNYELKSRKFNYSKFPTTMITENKLCGQKKLILLFNFTDGLYYIEYDEIKFATYERVNFSRAGIDFDRKMHVYIPIFDLTKITP